MQVRIVSGRIGTVLAFVVIMLVGVAPAASAAPNRATADRLAFQVDLATVERVVPDSGFRWSSDGCSTPAVGDLERWNSVFQRACDRHDFSYGVYGYGGDVAVLTETQRQRIDDQFLRDMNGICIATYAWYRRGECLLVARAYYTVVRQVGVLAYYS
jgi:hypothetical protein